MALGQKLLGRCRFSLARLRIRGFQHRKQVLRPQPAQSSRQPDVRQAPLSRLERRRQRRGRTRLPLPQYDPPRRSQHNGVEAELCVTVTRKNRLPGPDDAVSAAANSAPRQVRLVILAPVKTAESFPGPARSTRLSGSSRCGVVVSCARTPLSCAPWPSPPCWDCTPAAHQTSRR